MPDLMAKADSLSDFLNPLLVRELRQSLRGNVFSGAIILTSVLCALAIVCGLVYQYSNPHETEAMRVGQTVFYSIFSVLWFISCVAIPVGASGRFRGERSSGEFELFSITGVSPYRIINGKLLSALVQSFLVLSVAAPFMMACYMLRGISALSIGLAIVNLFIISASLTQCGIMLGSMNISKVLYSLLNVGFVCGLLFSSFNIVLGALAIRELSSREAWVVAAILALSPLYGLALSYFSSVAMLQLPDKNKGFWLKSFLLLSALALPGLLLPLDSEPRLAAFYGFFALPACIAALFMTTVADIAPPAVRRRWAASRLKMFRPLLYPGKGSMLAWLSVFMGVLGCWEYFFFGRGDESCCVVATLGAALSFWILLGGGALGLVFRGAKPLALACIGLTLPSVTALLLAFSSHSEIALLFLPPGVPFYVESNHLWPFAFTASMFWWGAIFVYGLVCHFQQLAVERGLDRDAGKA